jgi:hypothetical protein
MDKTRNLPQALAKRPVQREGLQSSPPSTLSTKASSQAMIAANTGWRPVRWSSMALMGLEQYLQVPALSDSRLSCPHWHRAQASLRH